MDDFLNGKKYSAFIYLAFPFRYFLLNMGAIRPLLLISIIVFPLNIYLITCLYMGLVIFQMGVYGAGLAIVH